MIQLSEFSIHYYSEVSARVMYRYNESDDLYEALATHVNPNVSISCWYHFINGDRGDMDDPLIVSSSESVKPLALMADSLSPAAVDILENFDVDEPRRQFFVDFMCALAHGHYSIYDDRAVDYSHDAGDWLLQQYEQKI